MSRQYMTDGQFERYARIVAESVNTTVELLLPRFLPMMVDEYITNRERNQRVRINLYEEELTDEVRLVTKTAENTGITYYGVRFYLRSAPELHATPDDDDRSAVTFWFGDRDLCQAFRDRCAILLQNPAETLKGNDQQ